MTTAVLTQKAFSLGQSLLLTTCAVMFVAAVHPTTRTALRAAFLNDQRTLVSSARGDLAGTGEEYTVAKVKSRSGLFLEIYKNENDGRTSLVEKIEMPETKDGFFSFNGHATNLALADIDSDGRAEILVPSFDRDQVGRLNIFRFNGSSNGFEKVVQ